MPRTRLLETIEQLRQEIDSGASLDAGQLDRLGAALQEIEAMLESDDSGSAEDGSILAKLREAEADFEESHPTLTHAIGAVANALSKLGI